MSLKSLFKKIIPGKKTGEESAVETQDTEIQYEMPLEKLDTRIEKIGTIGEIDIYVNDIKTTIHTLASETKIGRDPAISDIAIPELIVSKLHCTIYPEGDHFFIRDNESTNGVYVNNERISIDQQLRNDDVILLGKKGTVRIIFHKR